MTEVLLNTLEVSRMLQVDKSTVKRWTDEGKLKCFRTPGGHRKFRAEDLQQFISEYNYGISQVNFYPQFASDEAIIRSIITRKEYHVLTNVCFSASINGRKDELVKFFTEVYKNGLTLPLLFDEILRPAIQRITDLNISGKLSAAEIQLAFNVLSTGVVLLSDIVAKPTPSGKKAICATVEPDAVDILLKALVVLLESEGYEVLNLGIGAGTDVVCQLIESRKPQYVFLCAFHPASAGTMLDKLKTVMETSAPFGTKVIIGGDAQTFQKLTAGVQPVYDKLCPTFKDFANVHHDVPVNQQIVTGSNRK